MFSWNLELLPQQQHRHFNCRTLRMATISLCNGRTTAVRSIVFRKCVTNVFSRTCFTTPPYKERRRKKFSKTSSSTQKHWMFASVISCSSVEGCSVTRMVASRSARAGRPLRETIHISLISFTSRFRVPLSVALAGSLRAAHHQRVVWHVSPVARTREIFLPLALQFRFGRE